MKFRIIHDKLGMSQPGAARNPWLVPGGKPLLPSEPRLVNTGRQQALTQQYLLPDQAALMEFFLALRLQVDAQLAPLLPGSDDKPYPLGRCLEITKAVGELLESAATLPLTGTAAAGRDCFLQFMNAGGSMRIVWGDLRGQFFQNAFIMGTLYVDVSNDTVVLTKPKIEILPFADAGLSPIADFQHFARIASAYWHNRLFPNHLLPELAPYCPLLRLTPSQHLQLTDTTVYMTALTLSGRFTPSEQVLAAPPLPAEQFAALRAGLATLVPELPPDASAGRQAALQNCRQYRAKRWQDSRRQSMHFINRAKALNTALAAFTFAVPPGGELDTAAHTAQDPARQRTRLR